jgi:alkanesulfonate monooxygenase SsuD/methylene tetrahydromethanopterin reductase-like flavin-dependent oxidoreductase (luciferase family)
VTADIFLTSRYGPARSIDLARVAQRAGLGGVWLAEHYFIEYGRCPSATVLAGAILAATSSLTVGTAACVMSARPCPARAGGLDHLMTVRAGPVPGIGNVIRMVEAAGSVVANAALIENLETVC